MLPAVEEDAVLSSTAAPACEDDAAEEADEVAAEEAAVPVAGLVAAGEVPELLPQPVRAAARARMARPGPGWCFMVCSLGWIISW
jgi:hypothetical protein